MDYNKIINMLEKRMMDISDDIKRNSERKEELDEEFKETIEALRELRQEFRIYKREKAKEMLE